MKVGLHNVHHVVLVGSFNGSTMMHILPFITWNFQTSLSPLFNPNWFIMAFGTVVRNESFFDVAYVSVEIVPDVTFSSLNIFHQL